MTAILIETPKFPLTKNHQKPMGRRLPDTGRGGRTAAHLKREPQHGGRSSVARGQHFFAGTGEHRQRLGIKRISDDDHDCN